MGMHFSSRLWKEEEHQGLSISPQTMHLSGDRVKARRRKTLGEEKVDDGVSHLHLGLSCLRERGTFWGHVLSWQMTGDSFLFPSSSHLCHVQVGPRRPSPLNWGWLAKAAPSLLHNVGCQLINSFFIWVLCWPFKLQLLNCRVNFNKEASSWPLNVVGRLKEGGYLFRHWFTCLCSLVYSQMILLWDKQGDPWLLVAFCTVLSIHIQELPLTSTFSCHLGEQLYRRTL